MRKLIIAMVIVIAQKAL